MGATFSEKLLAAKAGQSACRAGEIVTIEPDVVMSHDNSLAISLAFAKFGIERVKYPDRIVIVLDHAAPAPTEKYAANHKQIREFVRAQGIKNFYDINVGICHQVLPERGHVVPGSVIVASDSHTTTYGAFGAFAAGIGRTETASIWALGELWLRVPETIRIEISGALQPGVFAKDLTLHIIGQVGADGADYCAVEFCGPAIDAMEVGDRMTLTNMAIEMGAKNGYMTVDAKTEAWLAERGVTEYARYYSDADATYKQVLSIDCSALEPQLAFPHRVDNVKPLSEAAGLKLDQVFIGTCTNGRLSDLEIAARMLKGRKVCPSTRLLVIPASREIYLQAMRLGYLETIAEAGGVIMNSGCGPCMGAHLGAPAPEERVLSTANRNFKGRMGCREAEIYLGSPAAAAAGAITGEIADPREFL
ncbi:3-isopropylmalate dehydratase large subunit [Candidatus Sumerlaeota bacterium]|nr:3-isopropylmalate dehydratase large subunit [Candidatus Sumerlaeota bacterium]